MMKLTCIAKIMIATTLVAFALSAQAKCDNQELKPKDKLTATFHGPAAGEQGKHQCKNARIRIQGAAPWRYSEFSAECNGVTVKGTLHYRKDCRVVDKVVWRVEGTEWEVTGGSHNERKDRTRVKLKNGSVKAEVKIRRD